MTEGRPTYFLPLCVFAPSREQAVRYLPSAETSSTGPNFFN